jgi:hypothetical protein
MFYLLISDKYITVLTVKGPSYRSRMNAKRNRDLRLINDDCSKSLETNEITNNTRQTDTNSNHWTSRKC